ncbi:MAG: SHOCT domain-containing protein [Gemmatimonadetes bacterium]|nr:SHOCT domain-containing protein [Gemmatimonadota bacterium]
MVIPGIVTLLFWGGLPWLGLQFLRAPAAGGYRGYGDDPLDIARRRLASGEITEEEYERLTARLRR